MRAHVPCLTPISNLRTFCLESCQNGTPKLVTSEPSPRPFAGACRCGPRPDTACWTRPGTGEKNCFATPMRGSSGTNACLHIHIHVCIHILLYVYYMRTHPSLCECGCTHVYITCECTYNNFYVRDPLCLYMKLVQYSIHSLHLPSLKSTHVQTQQLGGIGLPPPAPPAESNTGHSTSFSRSSPDEGAQHQ